MGVHPDDRRSVVAYRDVLGGVNQTVAGAADRIAAARRRASAPARRPDGSSLMSRGCASRSRPARRRRGGGAPPCTRGPATSCDQRRARPARRGRRVGRRWQRTAAPAVRPPAALIFAADHGVTAAGVSKYPADVTAAMLAAYRAGQLDDQRVRPVAGATVEAIDVGVGRPTGDIRFEPAMSPERFDEAADAGRRSRRRARCRPARARRDGDRQHHRRRSGRRCAGRRRGRRLGRARHRRRRRGPRPQARRGPSGASTASPGCSTRSRCCARSAAPSSSRWPRRSSPARHRQLPVLIDGYVVTAAVLPLGGDAPDALDHCLVGHCSAEPGHRRLLRTARQAAAARPRDAPRARAVGRDGRRAAGRDGVRRDHRGADVRRVVRLTPSRSTSA